jgi:hypothetical protein
VLVGVMADSIASRLASPRLTMPPSLGCGQGGLLDLDALGRFPE